MHHFGTYISPNFEQLSGDCAGTNFVTRTVDPQTFMRSYAMVNYVYSRFEPIVLKWTRVI
jgi:hypothetical protein